MDDVTINLKQQISKIDKLPNQCPQCHTSTHFVDRDIVGENIKLNRAIEIALICPKCLRMFVALYHQKDNKVYREKYYCLDSLLPTMPKEKEVDVHIRDVSPLFFEIYNQAYNAEQLKFSQISGLGYRKALEFLVKDFCISQSFDEENKIKTMQLMQCINLIPNEKIKQAASRAAWLGNDEAHYVRRYENKDIDDLKSLLAIVQTYIQHELLLQKYNDEMP